LDENQPKDIKNNFDADEDKFELWKSTSIKTNKIKIDLPSLEELSQVKNIHLVVSDGFFETC